MPKSNSRLRKIKQEILRKNLLNARWRMQRAAQSTSKTNEDDDGIQPTLVSSLDEQEGSETSTEKSNGSMDGDMDDMLDSADGPQVDGYESSQHEVVMIDDDDDDDPVEAKVAGSDAITANDNMDHSGTESLGKLDLGTPVNQQLAEAELKEMEETLRESEAVASDLVAKEQDRVVFSNGKDEKHDDSFSLTTDEILNEISEGDTDDVPDEIKENAEDIKRDAEDKGDVKDIRGDAKDIRGDAKDIMNDSQTCTTAVDVKEKETEKDTKTDNDVANTVIDIQGKGNSEAVKDEKIAVDPADREDEVKEDDLVKNEQLTTSSQEDQHEDREVEELLKDVDMLDCDQDGQEEDKDEEELLNDEDMLVDGDNDRKEIPKEDVPADHQDSQGGSKQEEEEELLIDEGTLKDKDAEALDDRDEEMSENVIEKQMGLVSECKVLLNHVDKDIGKTYKVGTGLSRTPDKTSRTSKGSGDESNSRLKKMDKGDLTPIGKEYEEQFSWDEYQKKTGAMLATRSSFKHIVSASSIDFEPGMKLEVPNQDSSNTYWLATVIAKAGPLILLRYEGYQDDNSADFWTNSQSAEIHPVGWCAKTKHALRPPKAIQHKEKSWYDYLIRHLTGARKAAEHLFGKKQSIVDKLVVGMRLEVIDSEDPSYYWVAIITEIYAGRLRLQYRGTDDSNGELWCYYLWERLHHPGYGRRNGLALRPPRSVLKTISEKEWPHPKLEKELLSCWEAETLKEVLKLQQIQNAVKVFPFPNLTSEQIRKEFSTSKQKLKEAIKRSNLGKCLKPYKDVSDWNDRPRLREHSFKAGMKLEAKHPKDPTRLCCATVARVFNRIHFLVRIDNLLNTAIHENDSFVCHKDSHGIYPVGWCAKYGLKLDPPEGYNGHFTWKAYLEKSKSAAAPESCFNKEVPEHNLRIGMKLEAVDQEHPANVCVATISQIIEKTVWILLDGDSRGEQINDIRSFGLFPAGWCEMSGHELQWPRPGIMEQKNRISRLRTTTTRQTRLDNLRKGREALRKSAAGSTGSSATAQPSADTSPSPQKQKKPPKSQYYKGSKRRKINRTEDDKKEDHSGYVDPSISVILIDKFTRDYNSEDKIKENFHLDPDGNVPKQIITIDSEDEDEDYKIPTLKPMEMDFFSCLKIKPNALHKSQEEEFDLKSGLKLPLSERKAIALSSVVERLRGCTSKTAARLRLIDFYKKQKVKQIRYRVLNGKLRRRLGLRGCVSPRLAMQSMDNITQTSDNGQSSKSKAVSPKEKDKENLQSKDDGKKDGDSELKVSTSLWKKKTRAAKGDKGKDEPHEKKREHHRPRIKYTSTRLARRENRTPSPPSSDVSNDVDVEDNAEYRVIGKDLTKTGEKSKIIIRLKKPTVIEPTKVIKAKDSDTQAQTSKTDESNKEDSSVPDKVPFTDHSLLVDGHSPARDNAFIDEQLTEKCNEIRRCSRDLPSNPLKWTKLHVAEFIQAAGFSKHTRVFLEQEIDGHALLLLTVHELHKLLSLNLGPALKLSDYIYTLNKEVARKFPQQGQSQSQVQTSVGSQTTQTPQQTRPSIPQHVNSRNQAVRSSPNIQPTRISDVRHINPPNVSVTQLQQVSSSPIAQPPMATPMMVQRIPVRPDHIQVRPPAPQNDTGPLPQITGVYHISRPQFNQLQQQNPPQPLGQPRMATVQQMPLQPVLLRPVYQQPRISYS